MLRCRHTAVTQATVQQLVLIEWAVSPVYDFCVHGLVHNGRHRYLIWQRDVMATHWVLMHSVWRWPIFVAQHLSHFRRDCCSAPQIAPLDGQVSRATAECIGPPNWPS